MMTIERLHTNFYTFYCLDLPEDYPGKKLTNYLQILNLLAKRKNNKSKLWVNA